MNLLVLGVYGRNCFLAHGFIYLFFMKIDVEEEEIIRLRKRKNC